MDDFSSFNLSDKYLESVLFSICISMIFVSLELQDFHDFGKGYPLPVPSTSNNRILELSK